jgi:hypothetical protein
MSGKLGGVVASKARGGIQYFRKLVTPSNPRSTLQTAVRNAANSIASYWQTTLVQADRDAWDGAATDGATGQTDFLGVNTIRQYANNANRFTLVEMGVSPLVVLTDRPVSLGTTYSGSTLVIDDSANTLSVTPLSGFDPFLAEAAEAGDLFGVMWIYVSPQQSPSRNARQFPYALARCIVFGASSTAPIVVNLATLGLASTTGQVMYVKIVVQDPFGGISTPTESRVIVTA